MLRILCLLSCFGAVFCGGIGLGEPLLQYPASTRTSIAYGNNAFLARFAAAPLAATVHQGIIAQPLAAHTAITATAAPLLAARTAIAAAPVVHETVAAVHNGIIAQPLAAHTAITATAAPILAARTAVAAPAVAVAAAPVVSSVHHVPAVAQVPVTKYEAQPAVIQNVVDVANPKVATRKFEIRRPAIQKEFYDIEERVVVRPAGSAVVELDQPISKNQRGPTLVSPVGAAAAVRTVPYATHLHTQAFLPALPALSIQSYPVQGPTLQQPEITSPGASPIQQQPTGPSTARPESDQSQFDDSDSVSVENPEFGTARIAQQQQQDQRQDSLLQQRLFEQSIAQAEARSQLEYQAQAQAQAREAAQQEVQARAQAQQEAQARAQAQQEAQAQANARAQQEYQARARAQAQQQILDQQQVIDQLQARLRSQEATQRQSPEPAPVRENVQISSRTGEARFGDITLSRASVQEIPSVRNLPEVELSNQARLIALLTERGPVSEVRSGVDGLDSRVRARVLSATPAPPNVQARDEKVSTRRVVVNRPIQTVQEVDVVEPFTKIERVAVNQPAFIKTARLGVANVATSVPVHTYAHAHYAF
ncbi:hypothetical protein O3M35_000079 [Rhynocoris fuscipes]|uniref:Uncharacterized protein n=1 Tax=Rhynocoris fuscipes TaxID=488301 RepID=A0AAW1DMH1_9HEMI